MHNWYTTFYTRFGISVKNRITWVIYIFDLSLMKKKISKKRILQKIWPLLYLSPALLYWFNFRLRGKLNAHSFATSSTVAGSL